MKTALQSRLLAGAAFALAAIALLYSARTIAAIPRQLAQIARRHGDVLQLQGLLEKAAQQKSAFTLLAEQPATAPDLAGWLRAAWPDLPVEVKDRDTSPLLDGWSVHRIDVRIDDATLADVARLWSNMETQRPPWRVVECQVAASGAVPGRGRMTMIVENLKRTDPSTTPR